jgi:hypothetical protein
MLLKQGKALESGGELALWFKTNANTQYASSMLASYNGNPPSSVRPMQMPNVQES